MNESGNNQTNVNGTVTVGSDNLVAAPTVSTVATPQTAPTVSSASTSGTSGAAAGQLQCDKCGTFYPSSQRYCMKCGALNYSHPDNQSMKQYINYDVINHSYVGNYKDKLSHDTFDPIVKMNRNCLIGNIVLHLLCFAAIIGFQFSGLVSFSTSTLVIFGIVIAISFLYNYSMSRIYMHAGKDWWALYVPIYGQIVYYNITMDSGWWYWATFIPILNFIIPCIALYKLGTRFGKSGWFTLFCSLVMIPVIAFSDTTYAGSLKSMHMNLGDSELDSKGKTKSEKKYGAQKTIIMLLVFIVLGVVVYLFHSILLDYAKKIIDFLIQMYNETMEIIGKYN